MNRRAKTLSRRWERAAFSAMAEDRRCAEGPCDRRGVKEGRGEARPEKLGIACVRVLARVEAARGRGAYGAGALQLGRSTDRGADQRVFCVERQAVSRCWQGCVPHVRPGAFVAQK